MLSGGLHQELDSIWSCDSLELRQYSVSASTVLAFIFSTFPTKCDARSDAVYWIWDADGGAQFVDL